MDIQQASVRSDPKATVNLGASQVLTQLSEHLQRAQTLSSNANALPDQSSIETQLAAQVMQELNYTIPRVNPVATVKAKSKELAETKSEDEQKQKIKFDKDFF